MLKEVTNVVVQDPGGYQLFVQAKLLSEIDLTLKRVASAPIQKRSRWEEAADKAEAQALSEVEINRKCHDLETRYPDQSELLNRRRRRAIDELREKSSAIDDLTDKT